MCLRGVQAAEDMIPARLTHAHNAVTHGLAFLNVIVDSLRPPVILYTTKYTHVNVAFAAVLLLNMMELVPCGLDEEAIISLVKQTRELLGQISDRSHANTLDSVLSKVDEVCGGRKALFAHSLFVDASWPWTAEGSDFVFPT